MCFGYEESTWITKDEEEGIVYGSRVIYDDVWGTHQKLMKVLSYSLPFGVRYVSFSVKMEKQIRAIGESRKVESEARGKSRGLSGRPFTQVKCLVRC